MPHSHEYIAINWFPFSHYSWHAYVVVVVLYTHTKANIHSLAYLLTHNFIMVLSMKQYFLDIFKLIFSIKRKWERTKREWENENMKTQENWSRVHISLCYTSVVHTHTHTYTIFNILSISEFMFRRSSQKVLVKTTTIPAYIHPKSGTFETLWIYLYMIRSHYPANFLDTLWIDANPVGWKMFCSRNLAEISFDESKYRDEIISNLTWWCTWK